jgi:hypothetical protein
MADRSQQQPQQPTPTHNSSTPAWRTLTYAAAVADCPTHRAQHEQAVARHAEFSAANGASTARRDRIQLSLQLAKRTAVTA